MKLVFLLLEQGLEWKIITEITGIPRSTYYRLLGKEPSLKEQWDDLILRMIRVIAASNNSLYGYRKMTLAVEKRFHLRVSRKRIRRIMCAAGIVSNFRNRPKRKSRKSSSGKKKENILDRRFEAAAPRQKYLSDVTMISTGSCRRYLCIIYDLYCNYPVGWALSSHNDVDLVLKALENAGIREFPPEMIHSDQGSNYLAIQVQELFEQLDITVSMSRVGKCIDNAPMESFNGIFKGILKVLFPDIGTADEIRNAVEKTMDFYKHEYVSERFGIRSLEEIWRSGLEAGEPEFFPIPENPRIIAWKLRHGIE